MYKTLTKFGSPDHLFRRPVSGICPCFFWKILGRSRNSFPISREIDLHPDSSVHCSQNTTAVCDLFGDMKPMVCIFIGKYINETWDPYR